MLLLSVSFVLALGWLNILAIAQPSGDDLAVDVGYARYQGVNNASVGVNSWFGIYYAASPTGNLRWRPPVPIESSNNVSSSIIDARNTGPICPQGYPAWRYNATPGSTTPVEGSENCLLLDVHTPARPQSTSLPVLLQIHGGGYTQNFAEFSQGYSTINKSDGNLIYVTIQYRLGAYGFLSSDEIKSDGSANVGLLDQEAAVLWTKKHIGAFGGDPDKITIIGGSAGGGSVMAQLILRGGSDDPPFRAAIAEYPWLQQHRDDARLQKQYEQLLQASKCSDLECLRAVPENDLLWAQQNLFLSAYPQSYGYGDFYFGPTVDGELIQNLPSMELENGHFSKVPLLTNRDGYEGYGYTNKSLNSTSGTAGLPRLIADIQSLYPPATESFLSRLLHVYPASDYNSTFWQRSSIFGDATVDCPSYRMASQMGNVVPTWKFIFRTGSQTHSADSPFLWNFTFGESPSQNATVADILKDYYISFVTSLDPNAVSYTGTSKPTWPVYMGSTANVPATALAGSNFQVLEFNDTNIEARQDPDAGPVCDFWTAAYAVVRN